jgi:uncharacterized membrane protein
MLSGVSSRIAGMEESLLEIKRRTASLEEGLKRNIPRAENEAANETKPGAAAAAPVQIPAPETATISRPAGETIPAEPLAAPGVLPEIEEERPSTPPPLPPGIDLGPLSYPSMTRRSPSWAGKFFAGAVSWLLVKGHIWVSAGVVLLLAGFGLLFNYAVQRGWLSLELRLALAAAAGLAMTAFGWKTRERDRTYALITQGGGIGVLYMVFLAGAKFGPVIPVPVSIIGMLALSVFTVALALYQDFEPLAIFALFGGYAAPILVSSGSSNFVALFSIYSLLNLEILVISFFRNWRKTRWGGLILSVLVGISWGVTRWRPAYFGRIEIFLALFFVTFSLAALAPAVARVFLSKNAARKAYAIDTPMAATVPFVFIFLQMAAASGVKYGVAIACAAAGAWQFLSWLFVKKNPSPGDEAARLIYPAYAALFANLAVPFLFRQASASSIWAVEGAAFTAFAARKKEYANKALAGGIALHVFAFVLYNFGPYLHLPARLYGEARQPGLLNWRDGTSPFLLTGLFFAASALASSLCASLAAFGNEKKNWIARPIAPAAFAAYGTLWLTLAVWHNVFVRRGNWGIPAFSVLCLAAAAGYIISSRVSNKKIAGFQWRAARIVAAPPVAAAFVFAVAALLPEWPPYYLFGALFGGFLNSRVGMDITRGYMAWNLAAFLILYVTVVLAYRKEPVTKINKISLGAVTFSFVYYVSFALMTWANVAFPPRSFVGPFGETGGLSYLVLFAPVFVASAKISIERVWKFFPPEYKPASAAALGALVVFYLPPFVKCFAEPAEWMARYVPILNTLELWQALLIVSAALLLRLARESRVKKILLWHAVPFAAFVWLNSVAARSALHIFREDIYIRGMMNAPYFQGLVAILWGLAALGLIFAGKRRAARALWFMGAGLLAADIIKLILIDMRNSATIIRILAFLLLGGLFMLIGWAAPLPPKSKTEDAPPRPKVI